MYDKLLTEYRLENLCTGDHIYILRIFSCYSDNQRSSGMDHGHRKVLFPTRVAYRKLPVRTQNKNGHRHQANRTLSPHIISGLCGPRVLKTTKGKILIDFTVWIVTIINIFNLITRGGRMFKRTVEEHKKKGSSNRLPVMDSEAFSMNRVTRS